MDHQRVRSHSNPADGRKILAWIIARIGIETRGNAERSGVSQHDRVSVGRASGDLLGSNCPSRSGALVNNDLLAKCLGELIGDDPSNDAGATAGRKGVHYRNWPDRIRLRQHEARHGRQRRDGRGETQKLPTAGKFHDALPEQFCNRRLPVRYTYRESLIPSHNVRSWLVVRRTSSASTAWAGDWRRPGRRRYPPLNSISGRALRIYIERIERMACSHEQPIALAATEANIGAALRQRHKADRLAFGIEHFDAVEVSVAHAPAAPQIAVHVDAEAIRCALD